MYVNIKLFSLSEIGIHIDLELSEFDVHVHGAIFTFSRVKQSTSMPSYWAFGSIICDDILIKGQFSNVMNYNGYQWFTCQSCQSIKLPPFELK